MQPARLPRRKRQDGTCGLHTDVDEVVASAEELASHAKERKQALLILTDGADNASELGRTKQSAGHSGVRIGEGIAVFCVAPVSASEIFLDDDIERTCRINVQGVVYPNFAFHFPSARPSLRKNHRYLIRFIPHFHWRRLRGKFQCVGQLRLRSCGEVDRLFDTFPRLKARQLGAGDSQSQ